MHIDYWESLAEQTINEMPWQAVKKMAVDTLRLKLLAEYEEEQLILNLDFKKRNEPCGESFMSSAETFLSLS